jgi:hypothetical protein
MKATLLALTSALGLCACAIGPVASATPQAKATTQTTVQAQVQLDRARQNYQEAVSELARSLNLDLRAVEAHRRDLGTIMPDFSDEEVRLRQRFGDGDRIGAWPAMRQLSLAWRARATPDQRLLAAARARSDAVLFSVMVSARDVGATNGELAALWDEAAALDPLAFEAHMGASRAALTLGDRARAASAAEMALSAARSPADRAEASAARDMATRGF